MLCSQPPAGELEQAGARQSGGVMGTYHCAAQATATSAAGRPALCSSRVATLGAPQLHFSNTLEASYERVLAPGPHHFMGRTPEHPTHTTRQLHQSTSVGAEQSPQGKIKFDVRQKSSESREILGLRFTTTYHTAPKISRPDSTDSWSYRHF